MRCPGKPSVQLSGKQPTLRIGDSATADIDTTSYTAVTTCNVSVLVTDNNNIVDEDWATLTIT